MLEEEEEVTISAFHNKTHSDFVTSSEAPTSPYQNAISSAQVFQEIAFESSDRHSNVDVEL